MEKKIELASLTTQRIGKDVFVLDRVSSTNDYVKKHRERLPHGSVVITQNQFAGRGRSTHSWEAEPGEFLAMTFLFKKDLTIDKYPLLPHCTGIAVQNALSRLTKGDYGIKWPNDVLLNGKKICGILCESVIEREQSCAVSGAGVNLLQPNEFFSCRELTHATSLLAEGIVPPEPLELASCIIHEMEIALEKLIQNGFASLREEYIEKCVTLGRRVRIIEKEQERFGQAITIDENGNLMVEFQEGKWTPIYYGEASVRGIDGYF